MQVNCGWCQQLRVQIIKLIARNSDQKRVQSNSLTEAKCQARRLGSLSLISAVYLALMWPLPTCDLGVARAVLRVGFDLGQIRDLHFPFSHAEVEDSKATLASCTLARFHKAIFLLIITLYRSFHSYHVKCGIFSCTCSKANPSRSLREAESSRRFTISRPHSLDFLRNGFSFVARKKVLQMPSSSKIQLAKTPLLSIRWAEIGCHSMKLLAGPEGAKRQKFD